METQNIFFDDVAEGDAGPALSHQLTRTDLVMYAGASGDFNPMHTDEVKAKEAGLPSVFGHGMFSAGLLATAITNYVGIGNLASYRMRFTKQTWPGEMLSTSVAVIEKRPGNLSTGSDGSYATGEQADWKMETKNGLHSSSQLAPL